MPQQTPGAAYINGKRHNHGAQNDKRAAKQQPESHVQSVLHLIDIIGQSCDQGGGSKTVKLRIGKSLYMIKHRLTKLCGKSRTCFCCEKTGR